MPLDVNSNYNRAKATVVYSKCTEVISVINLLADTKHHEYAKNHINGLSAGLTRQSRELLGKISGLPYQGAEFLEFLLESHLFSDVHAFAQKITGYPNDRFIYILTGEVIPLEKIRQIASNRSGIDTLLDEMPWVFRGDRGIFEDILYHTDEFKQNLSRLIIEADSEYLENLLTSLSPKYKQAVAELNKILESVSPLGLTERLMNKKLTGAHQITEYIFVPSYFISPHYVMAYNKRSRLTLYDFRKEGKKANKSRRDLSAKLKILADETRLEILRLLILQPSYGKRLSARLGLTTSTISHHLDQLQSAGLISNARDKNTKYFSANEKEIDSLIAQIQDYLYNK